MDVFYSAKAGVGCSTVAAATAMLSAQREPTLLIDGNGDLDLLVGCRLGNEPPFAGLSDWVSAADPPPDALARLERGIAPGLSLVPFGAAPWSPSADRLELLCELLRRDGRRVIVDLGRGLDGTQVVFSIADQSVLVIRACYLALSAALDLARPDRVVVVAEQGRALREQDIKVALQAQRIMSVPWRHQIAHAIDAGVALAELPKRMNVLGSLL